MVLIGFAVIFYYRKGSFANVRLFPYLFVKLIFKQCSNASIQYLNFLASEHPIAVFQKQTLRRQLRFLLPQLYRTIGTQLLRSNDNRERSRSPAALIMIRIMKTEGQSKSVSVSLIVSLTHTHTHTRVHLITHNLARSFIL